MFDQLRLANSLYTLLILIAWVCAVFGFFQKNDFYMIASAALTNLRMGLKSLDFENSFKVTGKEQFGLTLFQNTIIIFVVFTLSTTMINHNTNLKKFVTWFHMVVCWSCIQYANYKLFFTEKASDWYRNVVTSTSILMLIFLVIQFIVETDFTTILLKLFENDMQFTWVLDHVDSSLMVLNKKNDAWYFKYVNKPFLESFESEL